MDENNLRKILTKQKDILLQLEKEVTTIENIDINKENININNQNKKLMLELENKKSELLAASEKLDLLSQENKGLKNALYEQVYNEKLNFLDISHNKMSIYFKSNFENEMNKLLSLENKVKNRIDNMRNSLKSYNVNINDEVFSKLDEISILVSKKMESAKSEASKNTSLLEQTTEHELERLRNEELTNEQILAVTKKNNVERFIGLNLINKIGLFLIIIGVIAAYRSGFFSISDVLKGILMFGLGTVLIVSGELLNRKTTNVFSLGLTAGGVAVLYIALSISYFGLKILTMYPALILCVLITVVAFVLSTRHNSQTIAIFAVIGGYLPLFSISQSETLLFSMMVYLIFLNLFSLFLSFTKKWTVQSFIGLFLNIIGTSYICMLFRISSLYSNSFYIGKIIIVSYVVFAFTIYMLIPIIATYKSNAKFNTPDVVLIAINTFFSSVIMYILFYDLNLSEYNGLLAIIFATVYLLTANLIERKFVAQKNILALFYLTGFSFVVLIIPFQFGIKSLTIGWLIEGVCITTYAILKDEKKFKKIGLVIDCLCLLTFFLYDILFYHDYLFTYKYGALTLGSIIILAALIYKKELFGVAKTQYKYFTIVNSWFFISYLILVELKQYLNFEYLNSEYLVNSLAILISFIFAYTVSRSKILYDQGVKIICLAIYIIEIINLVFMNLISAPTVSGSTEIPTIITLLASFILIGISLLSVFAFYDFLKRIMINQRYRGEWIPFILSLYFVLEFTFILIARYHLEFTSIIISVIYVITSLIWISFGFAKKYVFIRRFGLSLTLLSVVKLFLLDFEYLSSGYRVISYFALGFSLLAISFIYQYFNKLLELKGDVIVHEKNKS